MALICGNYNTELCPLFKFLDANEFDLSKRFDIQTALGFTDKKANAVIYIDISSSFVGKLASLQQNFFSVLIVLNPTGEF